MKKKDEKMKSTRRRLSVPHGVSKAILHSHKKDWPRQNCRFSGPGWGKFSARGAGTGRAKQAEACRRDEVYSTQEQAKRRCRDLQKILSSSGFSSLEGTESWS